MLAFSIFHRKNLRWPDFLDRNRYLHLLWRQQNPDTLFEYFQKKKCLENLFSWVHAGGEKRKKIPPIFIFIKEGKKGRDYRFRGLAVPGNPIFSQTEDLVSVWKSKNGQRFQNYKAIFSVLSVDKISREWITDIQQGNTFSKNCPDVWKKWIETGNYKILKATDEKKIKTKEEQMPQDLLGKQLLKIIYEYFSKVKNVYDFEIFAGKIFQMTDPDKIQDFMLLNLQETAEEMW